MGGGDLPCRLHVFFLLLVPDLEVVEGSEVLEGGVVVVVEVGPLLVNHVLRDVSSLGNGLKLNTCNSKYDRSSIQL